MIGNILISQLIIPFYRVNFFNLLLSNLENSAIITGISDGSTNTSPSHHLLNGKIIKTDNIHYLNNNFWRQENLFSNVFKYKIIVITFSLRNLDMYWLLLLKILGLKRVYLWGHIRGKNKIGPIRFIFARIATNFIFYTRTDAIFASSSQLFAKRKLAYLGNSCVSSAYCARRLGEISGAGDRLCDRKGLIYSGRLVPEKGVSDAIMIFLDAFCFKKNSFDYFYIVGEGSEESLISSIINAHPYGSRIKLLGKITDDEKLAELYRKCSASISNGYVGLNSIQSFANGVPMFVLNGPLHSPEIESCDTNLNTVFYNSEIELRGILENWNSHMKYSYSPVKIITNVCKNYTIENMSENFVRALS